MLFEYPENATPISDESDLLTSWIQNMNDLNRVEAENIGNAKNLYFKTPIKNVNLWFSTTELKKIHKKMFENVWKWAGRTIFFRKKRTNPSSSSFYPSI